MLSKAKLEEALDGYKEFLPKHWGVEKYKWQVLKTFQDEWDLTADDFHAMLERALPATVNLLATNNYFPGSMILQFAEAYPEDVRLMFAGLYDEATPLGERLDAFDSLAKAIMDRPEFKGKGSHYQDHRAMTTYLWLRYPERYFLYQYSLCKAVAIALESDFVPKKGKGVANIEGSQKLFGEIADALASDPYFRETLDGLLADDCHDDPAFTTLATDFSHYLWKFASKVEEWWPDPKKYDPGITADQWKALMEDGKVFTEGSLVMLGCMLAIGGEATCSELAERYGRTYGWYNSQASSLAERVAFETDCSCAMGSDGKLRWWPILFQGRDATGGQAGAFVWRLRPELREALRGVDWSRYQLDAADANKGTDSAGRRYWWVNANESYWSWDSIAVGESVDYESVNPSGNKRQKYKYFLEAKAGDMVIGYHTHPLKKIACLGEVTAGLTSEGFLPIRKVAEAKAEVSYDDIKAEPRLANLEYVNSGHTGTIFAVAEDEFEAIAAMAGFETEAPACKPEPPAYTEDDFLDDVFMSEKDYDALAALLKRRKNVILKGAPGTGKTYAAKRLAWSMMGCRDESRVKSVQFHQSSSYEDFVAGYRPDGRGGFEVRRGVFLQFCEKAAGDKSRDYFIIIDEINRANVSRVFGELLMLIEDDHRGEHLALGIDGSAVCVPENLYIIGMMNTADRSLALIDYALRRRFGFFTMRPAFGTEAFAKMQAEIGSPRFDALVGAVVELNERIAADASLGEGFEIGHSYLCLEPGCDVDAAVESVVEYDLVPLVEEYWFDDAKKAEEARCALRESIA